MAGSRLDAFLALVRRGRIMHGEIAEAAGRVQLHAAAIDNILGRETDEQSIDEIDNEARQQRIARLMALKIYEHSRGDFAFFREFHTAEYRLHDQVARLVEAMEEDTKRRWSDLPSQEDRWSVPFHRKRLDDAMNHLESQIEEIKDGDTRAQVLDCLLMVGHRGLHFLIGADERGGLFIEPMGGGRALSLGGRDLRQAG